MCNILKWCVTKMVIGILNYFLTDTDDVQVLMDAISNIISDSTQHLQ